LNARASPLRRIAAPPSCALTNARNVATDRSPPDGNDEVAGFQKLRREYALWRR
jgi:hypothetical protein